MKMDSSSDLDHGVTTDLTKFLTSGANELDNREEDNGLDDNFFGPNEVPNEMSNEVLTKGPNTEHEDLRPKGSNETSSSTQNEEQDGDKVVNPFFVSLKGGPVTYMKNKDLYSYKRCLLLCRQDKYYDFNFSSLPQLVSKVMTKEQFLKLGEYLILIEGNLRIVKNPNHRKQSTIVDRHLLTHFNHMNLTLENDEIVIPLFEQTMSTCTKLYMPMYTYPYTIIDVLKMKMLCEYYNCGSQNVHVSKRFHDMFKLLEDTDYWTNDYNCRLNMTEAFTGRTFQHKDAHKNIKASVVVRQSAVKDSKARAVIQNILSPNNKNNKGQVGNYDLPFQIKTDFTDASSALLSLTAKEGNSDYKLYKISGVVPSITKEQVSELFQMTTDQRERYDLFNAFLLSKTHCHLVVNNSQVLECMNNLVTKLAPVYRYVFGYAWLTMYMEECIKKTRTTTEDRYVFDINTANKLPFFSYCLDDPHLNPYFTLLVDKKTLDASNNCHGLPMIKGYDNYGIDTLDGFKKKFNIFTTGREEMSIFDGLETEDDSNKWKHFAVGGSLIPSCAEKRNPLIEQLVKPEQSFKEQWSRFFTEYHNDSDIDLMCNKKSVFGFMDEVSKLAELVTSNLNEIMGNDVSGTVQIEPIKSLLIVVNAKYIEECMPDYDYDYIVANINSNEIKEVLYEKYTKSKFASNRKLRSNKSLSANVLYENFFKVSSVDEMNVILVDNDNYYNVQYDSDSDYCTYLNDVRGSDNKVPVKENIMLLRISENIKFKIKSEHLLHSIEVFRTKYEEFFSCVSRFHLPCVRGYYDGNNVYLLPSCITALMTHTNIDYKYFAGVRDPIDIINKYRMRGIGTIINVQEKMHMLNYNSNVSDLQSMFGLFGSKPENYSKHFGSKPIGDNIYKPGRFMEGYPDDTYNNPNYSYVTSAFEMYDNNTFDGALNFMKFKTIGEDGTVAPFKKWVLDAGYDCLT